MEALGSPSISRAPMGGSYAFRVPKTSVSRWQYNDNVCLPVSKFFLRLSREKSVKWEGGQGGGRGYGDKGGGVQG